MSPQMETKEGKTKLTKEERGVYEFHCPHCRVNGVVSVVEITPTELACKRLIHGVVRLTGQALGPHSSKAQCLPHIEATVTLNICLNHSLPVPAEVAVKALWGCGQAIHIIDQEDGMYAMAVAHES